MKIATEKTGIDVVMAKKHFWVSNTAMKKLTGVVGTCLDCGESRTDNLRGGTCPGYKKHPVAQE